MFPTPITIVDLGNKNSSSGYSENGQANPLRWYLLKQVEGSKFEYVTAKWKCKDFMNEVVCCYHTGKSFSIYGFSTTPKMINKETPFLPFELDVTVPYSMFEHNIAVVNEWLMDQGLSPVYIEQLSSPTKVFLALPLDALHSTYFMSVYTLLVRAAHQDTSNETFDQLVKNSCDQDRELLNAMLKKQPKDMPESQREYLVYCGPKYYWKHGEENHVGLSTGVIHDCGLCGWGSSKTWKE